MNSILTLLSLFITVIAAIDARFGKKQITGEARRIADTEGKMIARILTVSFLLLLVILLITVDLFNYEIFRNVLIFYVIAAFGLKAVLEWKYLEGTRHFGTVTVMFLSAAAVLVAFHLEYERKLTTYGDVMPALLEDETIERMMIERMDDRTTHETEDTGLIEPILSEPADMVMLETTQYHSVDYTVTLYLEDNQIRFFVSDEDVSIYKGGSVTDYEILEDNDLLALISQEIE